MTESSPMLSTREMAAILGIHPKTLELWARAGRVPAAKTVGGQYRFDRAAVMERLAA